MFKARLNLKNTFLKSSVCLAVGLSLSAYAGQVNAAEETIEHIEVNSNKIYRSTATKSSLKAIDTPASLTVIDQELLDFRQVDSVAKALRYVSGITSESRSTITIFDQYNIRGFDTYQSFYDGMPLLSNNAWNLFPQVDFYATESIEVLKGPASSLYGLVPPGGMVNQVAKAPQTEEKTEVNIASGNLGLVELGIDSSGQLSDNVDYRVIMLGKKRDGQQETTETERYVFAPSLGWQVSDDTHLTLSMYYQNDPQMVPSTPLPSVGTVYEAPYGKLDANAYAGDANWNMFERETLMLGYKLNHSLNDTWSFYQNFRYTDAKALQRNMYNYGLADDQTTLIRSAYETDEEIDGFTIDNQVIGTISLGESKHNLLFGFDYQKSDSTVAYGDTLGTDTPTIDLSNPDYYQINPKTLPIGFYTEYHLIDIEQKGFYIQDEITWADWTLLLNGRYDQFQSRDDVDNSYGGIEYGSVAEIDQSEFSGRLAAMYTFKNGIRPYLSYADSFEPVTGIDGVTGEAFVPTTAEQFEAGIKYQSADGSISLSTAYFILTKENVVVNTPDWSVQTQTGEVESKGFEMEANIQLTDNLHFIANLTKLDMTITEDELDPEVVGKTPVWVAENMASAWLNYYPENLIEGLMLGGGLRYVGESQLDKYNTDTVPSYTLVDLVASYELPEKYALGEETQITFSVSNLTDKQYTSACYDGNNCWMGAERMVEAGLKVSF